MHIIGDSLLFGLDTALRDAFTALGLPAPRLDARGNRGIARKIDPDPRTGLEAVDWLRSVYGDADCWVIGLGTNDVGYTTAPRYPALIERIVGRIGEATHHIWFVDVAGRAPRQDHETWNAALVEVVEGRPRLHIVPWARAAAQHPEWFGVDGLHLTRAGAFGRARLIAESVQQPAALCLPPPQPDADGLVGAVRERFPQCRS